MGTIAQASSPDVDVVLVAPSVLQRLALLSLLAEHPEVRVTRVAASAQEALDTCEREQPDVLIADTSLATQLHLGLAQLPNRPRVLLVGDQASSGLACGHLSPRGSLALISGELAHVLHCDRAHRQHGCPSACPRLAQAEHQRECAHAKAA